MPQFACNDQILKALRRRRHRQKALPMRYYVETILRGKLLAELVALE